MRDKEHLWNSLPSPILLLVLTLDCSVVKEKNLVEIKEFDDTVDVNKCLKQIKLHISFDTDLGFV